MHDAYIATSSDISTCPQPLGLILIRDINRENKINRISVHVQSTAQKMRAGLNKAVGVRLDERGLAKL